ncbi:UDP-N-acetylglucosamine--N-acetylmuramyl-(pentapeptide) pyrophosphoryl-undecaprenol N-acetylglucosamine transferase [Rubinisphaera italica]|uniref:UDP-N-acetylglucosamine--N-acetylmuramyl-(pentapeptide) pyrophosphoryl-undecaprenol N-acetylglucosamine transferase n=1 Tax=Rubinisphaera italica TaxID=2527969 RepID=A0A5C5XG20_9PLAN|nr:UDP-N-acetylglucosamine--N-acetylmuramyl-(pentapeptide) pyrophosphoryl-undecaprenol N-acetylglucosamine transferase [Rubinisphaera italica]TWT61125.1 UDP-N-acetylglucosamine--N-acetylmuramyl-(pentapeptide) pyrophosphoryl-undecaprenol N-acetylglucosamine transferase MurG [Rubinisphaera italica]
MPSQKVFTNKQPSILFAGGGTGGHIYPGIAVAERWQDCYPDASILFAGSGREIERHILAKSYFKYEALPFVSPRTALRHPLRFLKGWRESRKLARKILREFQPAAVIGLGGYASYPLVIAASQQQIPIILLEQNAVAGRANQHLEKYSSKVCISFTESIQTFTNPLKIDLTGNPLRQEIFDLKSAAFDENLLPTLLITGGSQGSNLINETVIKFFESYANLLKGWQIRHQTGNDSIAIQIRDLFRQRNLQGDVRPYFESPADLYQNVKLAIVRAGGTSLAELEALKIPAIIIPIANSVANHQVLNAKTFASRNAAVVIEESENNFQNAFSDAMTLQLAKAYSSPEKSCTDSCEKNFIPNAANQVVEVIKRLIEESDVSCFTPA